MERKGTGRPSLSLRRRVKRTALPQRLHRGKRMPAESVRLCISRCEWCSMQYKPLSGTGWPGLKDTALAAALCFGMNVTVCSLVFLSGLSIPLVRRSRCGSCNTHTYPGDEEALIIGFRFGEDSCRQAPAFPGTCLSARDSRPHALFSVAQVKGSLKPALSSPLAGLEPWLTIEPKLVFKLLL